MTQALNVPDLADGEKRQRAVRRRTVLMVAFYFPPFSLSSGYLRPLKFAEYLPLHGWAAEVLTVDPRVHAPGQCSENAAPSRHVVVHQACALDTARHLSLGGRYPWALAAPDRWWTWWLSAVYLGLRVIRQRRPAVIFSTYPIATAHLIGWTLHRITGIPWIAEFRDPMTDGIEHRQRVVRAVNRWIEQNTMATCAAGVFVAPRARDDYARRYPHVSPERLHVIANGYDDEAFTGLDAGRPAARASDEPLVLLHSGLIYPEERDPRPFFAALRALLAPGQVSRHSVRLVLRSTGYDQYYRRLIAEYRLTDVVEIRPPVPYREALREMIAADALVLFQGASVNAQIPAKAYEYMRARRPIFAVTDPAGDTASMLREAGVGCVARVDSEEDIRAKLEGFLNALRRGDAAIAADREIGRHSRRARTEELAHLLDIVAAARPTR